MVNLLLLVATSLSVPPIDVAPLSWSSYEYQYRADGAIPEAVWEANLRWVEKHLAPYGYSMVAIDGWGEEVFDEQGFRTSHSPEWKRDYADWSRWLQARGMRLGMYNNPLWVIARAAEEQKLVIGTQIPVGSLIDDPKVGLFNWVDVRKPGAEAYVRGYVRHYAKMGVRYLRVDFLSWFENGRDRYMADPVGRTDRPRADYETALRWMFEECQAHGMALSLVMPHLFDEGRLERAFGHMIRINEDASEGGWAKWSEARRGERLEGWSPYANAFDGLIYWSRYTVPGQFSVDPDFIRLNSFGTDDERKSVISLCVMAGAPIAVADQVTTIGHSLHLYQNRELLALHREGVMGRPVSHDPKDRKSLIWLGTARNGDRVVGLFNREATPSSFDLTLREFGIPRGWVARDLWTHRAVPPSDRLVVDLPARGCRILRFAPSPNGQTDSPVVKVASGIHLKPQKVRIEVPAGASVHFTLDGSTPSSSSARYRVPIHVTNRAVIKAIAVAPGREPSEVVTASLEVRPNRPLPTGWAAQGVGVSEPLSAFHGYGKWILTSAGRDIEGNADSMGFIFRTMPEESSVRVRLDSITATFDWAKAGLMVRSSLRADAANVFVGCTAGKGVVFQVRPTEGAATQSVQGQRLFPPIWLGLSRKGDAIEASYSPNGQEWTVIGSTQLELGPDAVIGLAHSAHQSSTLGNAVFSQLSL